jgi:hypothetical protein
MLHVGGRNGCALERAEDGPVFGAQIKCDEVAGPVVPRPTACGDGDNSGVPLEGKVMGRVHLEGASPMQRILSISGCRNRAREGFMRRMLKMPSRQS